MLAEPSMPERRPSPGLSLNLSSNNPFRNRASSPGFPSPANQSDRSSSASRPMSRNPFLSTFEAEFNKEARRTDLVDMSATMKASPKKETFVTGSAAEELFKNLTIDEPSRRREPSRPTHGRSDTDPRGGHRPSRSDEEDRDRNRGAPRGPPRPRGPPEPRRPMQGSPDRRERRARRNSDSSIIDKAAQEKEDRRRRERRREREREEKDRDGKSSSTRKVRKPQGLDLIDKLDVTGIYGPSMIHHDGPYDAVQPHRNRKKDQRAPMSAFPVGSANNSLGGAGPLNTKIDLDRIHGRGAEGFTDFNSGNEWKKAPAVPTGEFSAKGRDDIVHGEQTHGLGTSTFLEGAPASRTAVEQDFEQKRAENNGLGRKKSIAQRFRGISQPRRQYGDGPRIQSPEARYGGQPSPQGPYSAGALTQNKTTELNPFFDEYNKAYDNKGASIQANDSRYKDDSPPRAPLQRAITTDSTNSMGESKPTGFLGRMKSIKGGRRRQA
ncbi:Pal1 cell morphology protein-domain-containing protein [Boeremia exigua]|uniref:Pal1 cell morphology protein-domain-containing protein n=1 Tax=Boeremia exigua TaxID=749465 RepID=UPI001E8D2C92|nr:Pal1 cell morphology protein-domain-containing protein [Boeremia exigua]KAH6633564.1 Pal1 cell morphology protein-domain-containing protein [Boeremia exigua]